MKHKWENPKCNICQKSTKLTVLLDGVTTWEHKGQFTYLKCATCGLVFQSPRPVFSAAINYYPSTTYWGRNVKKSTDSKGLAKEQEEAYGNIYKWVFERKNKPGTILDIGSGLGLFLSKFKKNGWQVQGTDISPDVAKYSKKMFGIDVKIGDVVKMDFPKKHYDIISLISVMEHVYDPYKTAVVLKKSLKDDGILTMLIPNISGLGRPLFRKTWVQLQPARHLYLFSPETITLLLQKAGYKVVEIRHDNWSHNFYSIFQSFRLATSSKFKTDNLGGLATGKLSDVQIKSDFSLFKEIGKVAGLGLAAFISLLMPLLHRSDAIVVYAKKA
jgi:2-polyprenyl-3-methyl-5-hydroxy-6-metoxy-1,4-benzoquinol methylase